MDLKTYMGKYLIVDEDRIIHSTFSIEETRKFLETNQLKEVIIFRWNEIEEVKLCKRIKIKMKEGYQPTERR
jgi:hypothetical protein